MVLLNLENERKYKLLDAAGGLLLKVKTHISVFLNVSKSYKNMYLSIIISSPI